MAGTRVIAFKNKTAFAVDPDLAEKVDGRDQVAAGEAVFADFDQEAVLAGAVHAVAVLLVGVFAVLGVHASGVEQQAQRIVPAEAVGGDRGHGAPHVAHQHMAARVMRGVLRLKRIGHVVAFERLARVVEHQRQVGSVTACDEAQRDAARQGPGPVAAAGNGFFPEQRGRRESRQESSHVERVLRLSWSSMSWSVFMPEVSRMRSSSVFFSARNSGACFMSCSRRSGSGTV